MRIIINHLKGKMQTKKNFPVTGLGCAACAARVTKILGKQPGIIEANVNFATSTAQIVYDTDKCDLKAVREAVQDGGYDILTETDDDGSDDEDGQYDSGPEHTVTPCCSMDNCEDKTGHTDKTSGAGNCGNGDRLIREQAGKGDSARRDESIRKQSGTGSCRNGDGCEQDEAVDSVESGKSTGQQSGTENCGKSNRYIKEQSGKGYSAERERSNGNRQTMTGKKLTAEEIFYLTNL